MPTDFTNLPSQTYKDSAGKWSEIPQNYDRTLVEFAKKTEKEVKRIDSFSLGEILDWLDPEQSFAKKIPPHAYLALADICLNEIIRRVNEKGLDKNNYVAVMQVVDGVQTPVEVKTTTENFATEDARREELTKAMDIMKQVYLLSEAGKLPEGKDGYAPGILRVIGERCLETIINYATASVSEGFVPLAREVAETQFKLLLSKSAKQATLQNYMKNMQALIEYSSSYKEKNVNKPQPDPATDPDEQPPESPESPELPKPPKLPEPPLPPLPPLPPKPPKPPKLPEPPQPPDLPPPNPYEEEKMLQQIELAKKYKLEKIDSDMVLTTPNFRIELFEKDEDFWKYWAKKLFKAPKPMNVEWAQKMLLKDALNILSDDQLEEIAKTLHIQLVIGAKEAIALRNKVGLAGAKQQLALDRHCALLLKMQQKVNKSIKERNKSVPKGKVNNEQKEYLNICKKDVEINESVKIKINDKITVKNENELLKLAQNSNEESVRKAATWLLDGGNKEPDEVTRKFAESLKAWLVSTYASITAPDQDTNTAFHRLFFRMTEIVGNQVIEEEIVQENNEEEKVEDDPDKLKTDNSNNISIVKWGEFTEVHTKDTLLQAIERGAENETVRKVAAAWRNQDLRKSIRAEDLKQLRSWLSETIDVLSKNMSELQAKFNINGGTVHELLCSLFVDVKDVTDEKESWQKFIKGVRFANNLDVSYEGERGQITAKHGIVLGRPTNVSEDVTLESGEYATILDPLARLKKTPELSTEENANRTGKTFSVKDPTNKSPYKVKCCLGWEGEEWKKSIQLNHSQQRVGLVEDYVPGTGFCRKQGYKKICGLVIFSKGGTLLITANSIEASKPFLHDLSTVTDKPWAVCSNKELKRNNIDKWLNGFDEKEETRRIILNGLGDFMKSDESIGKSTPEDVYNAFNHWLGENRKKQIKEFEERYKHS